jgi:hypothetical protein
MRCSDAQSRIRWTEGRQMRGHIRTARIRCGLVLVMWHLDSQQVKHGYLNPIPISSIRTGISSLDFGHSAAVILMAWVLNEYGSESSVFSFGSILYELVRYQPTFSKQLR